MRWRPRHGLWSHDEFLKLWAAQAVSAIGSRITRTAIPVLAVLAVDGSALELGVLSAITLGPGAVVGLLGGGAIDRAGKRRILIGADLLRAALVATIPLAAWFGALTMVQLYFIAGAIGCATALSQITDNAYLPALIGVDQLVEGNSKLETTEAIAEISGPGVAGILIEALTAPVAMVADAVTYLWSAYFLARIRAPERPAPRTAEDSLWHDLVLGLKTSWQSPLVRPILCASAVTTLSGGFFFALYTLYLLADLALSPAMLGVVISAGGVGALFGAVISPRLSLRLGTGRAMLLCLAFGQAGALLIPMAGDASAGALALLFAHQLIADGFMLAYMVQAVSLRQRALPGHLLARSNAVFAAVAGLLTPFGALLAGVAGELLGVRTALWVGVTAGLAAPLLLLPLRSYVSASGAAVDPPRR